MGFMTDYDSCDNEEDQELIEAVEVLVQTAAVSVWTGIMQDVQSFLFQCTAILEFLFPVLISYRQDQYKCSE